MLSVLLTAANLALIPPPRPPVIPWDSEKAEALLRDFEDRGNALGPRSAMAREAFRRAQAALSPDSSIEDRRKVDLLWEEYSRAFVPHWLMRVEIEALPMRLPAELSQRDAERIAQLLLIRGDILRQEKAMYDALFDAAMENRRFLQSAAEATKD